MSHPTPTGVLLINLGTPDAPTTPAVRRYLREFLMDPRVIDLPYLARWLLVHAVILPRRPAASARAYQKVWTDEGSPLLLHSQALATAVQQALGDDHVVELAMRYGSPSIAEGLERLHVRGAADPIVVPLFPQYAEASSGSALARVSELQAAEGGAPLRALPPFFDQPGFAAAWRAVAQGPLREFDADHVLFSYHGLPERQLRSADPTGSHCLASPDCCEVLRPGAPAPAEGPARAAATCYRAQCLATTRALTTALELDPAQCSSSFQSRLGRTPWIQPFTDEVLPQLAERGVRRLAIACPSFVADCLETLEEIGLRAREQWRELGGEALALLPCPNGEPTLARALATAIHEHVARETRASQPRPSQSAAAAPSPLAKASATDTPSV